VVAHGQGERDSWVILSLADWRAWFGDLPRARLTGEDIGEEAAAASDPPRATGDPLGLAGLTVEDLRALTSDASGGDLPRPAAMTRRRG
jgi:hypothetical protein